MDNYIISDEYYIDTTKFGRCSAKDIIDIGSSHPSTNISVVRVNNKIIEVNLHFTSLLYRDISRQLIINKCYPQTK